MHCRPSRQQQENIQLPKGVEVIGRVALNGQPVIRMYTQWEYGRTYLYIEHGRQSLTAVDITQKRNPQIVNHAPEKITPVRYEDLADGGTIQISPLWNVNAGIDSLGGRGMLSILHSGDPADAEVLNAFGPGYNNLADRDDRLVYFASAECSAPGIFCNTPCARSLRENGRKCCLSP